MVREDVAHQVVLYIVEVRHLEKVLYNHFHSDIYVFTHNTNIATVTNVFTSSCHIYLNAYKKGDILVRCVCPSRVQYVSNYILFINITLPLIATDHSSPF